MIVNADARFIPLADGSINCVITSPPYYGLRDYGTAKWEGGDPNCDHLGNLVPSRAGFNERYFGKPSSDGNKQDALREPMGQVCAKCGAVRIDNQIGLEQTPDEYIANLVDVFRECKRILRDDGTLWIVIGDSYSGSGNGSGDYREDGASISKNSSKYGTHKPGTPSGLKPKDLIGIPWMLAFALRADGWYLRQDIIWHKPNPMPESVKDRCTKSHEYIFLLSKSAKYYYDNEAVKDPSKEPEDNRGERGNRKRFPTDKIAGIRGPGIYPMANKRDVWTVTTKPYKGAHYATFPPDLIKPMILAGCPQFVCVKCGAPYERVVERVVGYSKECPKTQEAHEARGGIGKPVGTVGKSGGGRVDGYSTTLGFQPTCNCNAGTTSGIVLDPFVGSGTTVMVANELGRRGIGLDLNMKYLDVNARERLASVQPLIFA